LIEAVNGLSFRQDEQTVNDFIAFDIVRRVCFKPFKTILNNCGIEDHYVILRSIEDARSQHLATSGEDVLFTYNAKNSSVVVAAETGLLDPTKVTRTALENAASVAGTILTTESVIFEKKDKKDKQEDPMQGMY